MPKKSDYKQFVFEYEFGGHTDTLTGDALEYGAVVYATDLDAMYAGRAISEATYKKLDDDGSLPKKAATPPASQSKESK